MEYSSDFIGKRVYKNRKSPTPKPFKSGNKVNTVKGIINHPHLNIPTFVFLEDDSYVACRTCRIAEEEK